MSQMQSEFGIGILQNSAKNKFNYKYQRSYLKNE